MSEFEMSKSNNTTDEASTLHRLVDIVNQLRDPDGCPWDREQTLLSMRPYLLEECYEALDAMELGIPEQVAEELGDLLFVVLLLCRICQDDLFSGRSSAGLQDIARGIGQKMIERHPHVFGDEDTVAHFRKGDSTAVAGIAAWESRKPKRNSRLDGVPRSLPALLRAHRQAEKASAVGFDWPNHLGVLEKIEEEFAELKEALNSTAQAAQKAAAIQHEYGDLLLAVANLGRHIDVSPEESLRTANDRFASRFGEMERLARETSTPLEQRTASQLEDLWAEAKANLPSDS